MKVKRKIFIKELLKIKNYFLTNLITKEETIKKEIINYGYYFGKNIAQMYLEKLYSKESFYFFNREISNAIVDFNILNKEKYKKIYIHGQEGIGKQTLSFKIEKNIKKIDNSIVIERFLNYKNSKKNKNIDITIFIKDNLEEIQEDCVLNIYVFTPFFFRDLTSLESQAFKYIAITKLDFIIFHKIKTFLFIIFISRFYEKKIICLSYGLLEEEMLFFYKNRVQNFYQTKFKLHYEKNVVSYTSIYKLIIQIKTFLDKNPSEINTLYSLFSNLECSQLKKFSFYLQSKTNIHTHIKQIFVLYNSLNMLEKSNMHIVNLKRLNKISYGSGININIVKEIIFNIKKLW